MITSKELTIKEKLDEMFKLKARLIRLAEKYHRSLINVSAITWKDIVTKGGYKGDVMLNKQIKRDEAKDEFDIVLDSYNAYKEEVEEELREMIKNKSIEECIVYFRDTMRWKWKDICQLFNYSERQCRNLYNKGRG